MHRTVHALRHLVFAALVVGLCSAGCGRRAKVRFATAGAPVNFNGVSVIVNRTLIKRDLMTIKLTLVNLSGQPMMVDRAGFALRLPDGQIVQRQSGGHAVFAMSAGESRDFGVKFIGDGVPFNQLPQVSLIVGGISFASDPAPRIVGELPLVSQ